MKTSTSDGRTEWRQRQPGDGRDEIEARQRRSSRENVDRRTRRQHSMLTPIESSKCSLVSDPWPPQNAHLRTNHNPHVIRMLSILHFGSYGCSVSCRFYSCRNAHLGIFCTPTCSPFGGCCGNWLEESRAVAIQQSEITGARTIVAVDAIEKDVAVGEYLSELRLVDVSRHKRGRNSGYAFVMRTTSLSGGKLRVCVDAERFRSAVRFVNRACEPSVHLQELANGYRHMVVVVTCRAVHAGEELTVSYGDDLSFVCRCGSDVCVH
ncbi:hypothetical protein PybrP1_003498 [[Pythium] brassicae (nom. inval.)]|nr:hypothetical protein PybrP1_003498 [[Pythium] brassicae (nom. inval.)]